MAPPEMGAVAKWGLVKFLRLQGAEVDEESDTLGFSGEQMAKAFQTRCIVCVIENRSAP